MTVGLVALGLGGVWAFGVLAVERHVGYFAPVWDADGQHVLLLEREARGVIWGFGWEDLTPPAYAYVLEDRLRLQRIDPETGDVATLATLPSSPVVGRVTRHYRGRIFNPVSARLEPRANAVAVRARMDVPGESSPEQWSLLYVLLPGALRNAQWQAGWGGEIGTSEAALQNGVELLTVPGNEGFPAAALAVDAKGGVRVLVHNDDFAALYPDGVPASLVAERSQRASIEHAIDFRYVQGRLVEMYRAEGSSETEARLRAIGEMETRGYIPRSPRLVATLATEIPADVRVFDISEDHFRAGLFQDIGSAIATPGSEVETGTGSYLKYADDELGPQLRSWREAGNDRFGVRHRGRLYLLEVRRFGR